jgi:hypothetical protein
VYPVASKSEAYVSESLAHFAGGRRISLSYSDNAPEFASASRKISLMHETSVPGVPKTTSIIERANQVVLGGTATCLVAAGLPPCYWPIAAACFSFNVNVSYHEPSAWEMARGQPFDGKVFPFGCLVCFKRSPVRRGQDHFAPQSTLGVFAGHKRHLGFKWKRE